MKRILSLVLSLWSFVGLAQTTVKIAEIKPAPNKPGSTYYVQYERDWNRFPATSTGLSSLTLAIARGELRLTVSGSGCIIPAGTRPPSVPPTCSTPPTTTTAIVTIPAVSLQLSAASGTGTGADIGSGLYGPYGDNTQYRTHSVTAPVTANDYDIAIHYQTNTQTTGKANIVVNGSTNVEFDLEGAEGGKRTVHKTIALTSGSNTVRLEGKSGTPFFYDYIQLTRAASQSVVTTTPGTTTTTTPETTNPGSSTQPIGTFAAGYGEGSLTDLMQFAPFVPSAATDQLASWNIANVRTQFISSGRVKLGVHGIIGASVTHLSLDGGKNWANTNADGNLGTYVWNGQTLTGIADAGRSAFTFSMYGWPRSNYAKAGHGSTSEYYDTGRNPVPGGSVYRDYAGVQAFEKRILSNGRMAMYTKTNPYIWALHGYRSSVNIHNWFTFESNPQVVRAFTIVENGSDEAAALAYLGAEQEGPFAFLTADLYHTWIWQGTGPVTANGLREISPAQPTADANPQTNATFAGSFQGTRAFIGATDNNGKGVWLVPKYNNRFNVRRIQANDGDSTSNATSYIQSATMLNFDTKGNHAFEYQIFLGNKQEFADWYNTANPTTTPFSWSFTAGKTMGWWSADTPAKFNSDNRYEFTFGRADGSGGNFCPPYGVYNASEIPTLYIKGKFTNISQIDIRWNRFDQDDNASNQANQVTTVSNINGNGSEQTIAVPMSGKPGWNSVISSMRFAPHLGNSTDASQKFVPTYIGNVQPSN